MARVLIIDDESVIRTVVKETLKRLPADSVEITEAGDGEEGLKLCREQTFDLVITDVFMPRRDGLQLIQDIRKEFPGTRVIAISGVGVRAELDIISLRKSYGADDAFEKPFEPERLLESVKDLLAIE